MTTGKTLKVADKLIADGWKLVIIPVQRMFPNCQVKYKTKCTDMKSCDQDKEAMDKVAKKVKDWKHDDHFYFKKFLKVRGERVIQKRGLLDKLRKIIGLREKGLKPPKGFEGW